MNIKVESLVIPGVLLLIFLYLVLIVTLIISVTLSVGGFVSGHISFGIVWLGTSLEGSVGVIGLGLLWKKRFLNRRKGLI